MPDHNNAPSAFEELGFYTYLTQLTEEIQSLYLESSLPWVLGYSGGKDSTTVVQLVWNALAALSEEERTAKQVYVISTDTRVENPLVSTWVDRSLQMINASAREQHMPITAHLLKPKVTDSFWVNLIGRGYPAPSPKFRWCTERLKIWPNNNFILNVADKYGQAILALGSRRAESIKRAQHMKNNERYRIKLHVAQNKHLPNCQLYTPIEDWNNDDVWLYLDNVPNPWGVDNRDLLELYRGATPDRECPMIVGELETDTPSCGDSRFGCWTCTLVSRDRSLESMIANDPDNSWLQPLVNFRKQICVKDNKKQRDFRRRTGLVQIHNGKAIFGPYLQRQREIFLRELLRTQQQIRDNAPEQYRELEIITLDELREIRRVWITDLNEIEDILPKIYQEETGRDFPEQGLPYYHAFGERSLRLLRKVCGNGEDGETDKVRMQYEMLRELINIQWQYRTYLRRAGLFERMEEAIKKHFYESAADAVAFAEKKKDIREGKAVQEDA